MSHSILGLHLSDEHFPAMLKEISFEELFLKGQIMRKELADILPVMICNVCSCYQAEENPMNNEMSFSILLNVSYKYYLLMVL